MMCCSSRIHALILWTLSIFGQAQVPRPKAWRFDGVAAKGLSCGCEDFGTLKLPRCPLRDAKLFRQFEQVANSKAIYFAVTVDALHPYVRFNRRLPLRA
ncbi:hypothetical protein BDV96DRAFT_566206 [Lophiotrema nucula]|uniref:Uncharacterized protein n=1 Tax=Lophiotrema nucula TaxID=690887 RepID=A0A6A5ZKI2_9PLEO|nr:hypothetical protein BDV96DRAFT_566206 [Lophiotrema nucula]